MPIVPEATMYVCPKISDLQYRKQKEKSRGSGGEDKENQPAKVARQTLVPIVKSEDITDTDENLENPPVRDTRSTPRKPFGNSLDRSTNPVAIPISVHGGKMRYDQITAMKLRQERQDIPGIKREPHTDAVSSGCQVRWHVKTFDDGSFAHDEVKAAPFYGRMRCKRL